jgi:hypothetical protein
MIVARELTSNTIVGISLMSFVHFGRGARRSIVFLSGFTVIDDGHRGTNILQRAGFRRYLKERLRYPIAKLYLMYMAGTHQGYLLLPRNFKIFWPAPGVVMPPRERDLLNRVARDIYGDAWDADAGVWRRSVKLPWHPGKVEIDEAALQDPYVYYFLKRAPLWSESEALGCFCPLNLTNWSHALLRWLRRGQRAAAA